MSNIVKVLIVVIVLENVVSNERHALNASGWTMDHAALS